jgi:hypothetical protein
MVACPAPIRPPQEDAVSIDAAVAMRPAFLKDEWTEARPVLPPFNALVELPTGSGCRH